MKKHKSRQRILVNPELQAKILWHVSFALLLIFGLAGIAIAFIIKSEELYRGVDLRLWLLSGLGILFLVCLLVLSAGQLVFSNRIAGPLLNLSHVLGEVAAGNLTIQARVRKGDELQEYAAQFNQTINELNARVKRVRKFCEFTENEIQEMQKEKNDPALARISDLVKSVDEALEVFRT